MKQRKSDSNPVLLKRLFRRFGHNQTEGESSLAMAVAAIEFAAEFVKKYREILGCNQITMRQYGTVGNGWVVAFYGTDHYVRSTIEKLLADTSADWKLWEDANDGVLHITYTGKFAYGGSWRRFNRTVWGAVKRKHPDWKIKKNPSHECVLNV